MTRFIAFANTDRGHTEVRPTTNATRDAAAAELFALYSSWLRRLGGRVL